MHHKSESVRWSVLLSQVRAAVVTTSWPVMLKVNDVWSCRGFITLPALAKLHLVDSLCSSLSLLNASAAALLDSDGRSAPDKETVTAQHNSALQAYVFFLHWISIQAEQASRETTAKAATSASAASRGRTKAKKGAQIGSEWNWDADLEKIAKAVAGVVQIDLWQLCRPQNPDEAFLLLWSKTVSCSSSNQTTDMLECAT